MIWIDDPAFAADRPFGPQTLPYGVAAGRGVVVRVGDHALPLRSIAGALGEHLAALTSAPNLDALLAATQDDWKALRTKLIELVTADEALTGAELLPLADVELVLPFTVGDYVDFYSSRNHAENLGRLFRPDSAPLLPNWTHLPVGYHGRAGTVVVSGTEIPRPQGQRKGEDAPTFGPSKRLDIETEVGFVCGGPVARSVSTKDARAHVFGVALVNDWSARDIQAWEYVPLGPFLGKSFATSISAWITPLAAFDEARVSVPPQPNALQDYLVDDGRNGLDLALEVTWNDTLVSHPPFAGVNWSYAQQLAHMTVNGATVRPGDLFASGTVSGTEADQRGSFLELTWSGDRPVTLASGERRSFLEDGDTVVITGTAPGPGGAVVGLGEVSGKIVSG
jgi:fumarylacetoacetase